MPKALSLKNCKFLILLLLVSGCHFSSKTDTSGDEGNEWTGLFNGSNTDHWRGFHMDDFPETGWNIEDGELRNDGSGAGGLISREQYSNFILEWEWRFFDKGGNSGVKYFVKERAGREGKYAFGLEYQMLDDDGHANDYHTAGALYEFFSPSAEKQLHGVGQFKTSKLVVDGEHVEHWLNGLKVLEYERGGEEFLAMKAKSKFRDRPAYGLQQAGHILLQDHSSRVGFRNIRIMILISDSAKD